MVRLDLGPSQLLRSLLFTPSCLYADSERIKIDIVPDPTNSEDFPQVTYTGSQTAAKISYTAAIVPLLEPQPSTTMAFSGARKASPIR